MYIGKMNVIFKVDVISFASNNIRLTRLRKEKVI